MSKVKKDWRKKIAANRGAKWRKNVGVGHRLVEANPSLVRLHRLKKAWNQAEMALKLQMNPSTFGPIERGAQTVDEASAKKIASFLGQPVGKLFRKEKSKFIAVLAPSSI